MVINRVDRGDQLCRFRTAANQEAAANVRLTECHVMKSSSRMLEPNGGSSKMITFPFVILPGSY